MDEQGLTPTVMGTPQGAVISPLLANVYLHYSFDLWACTWRKKRATGNLGMLRVEGLAGSKFFQLLYRDRRGGGTATAGYVQPCKPSNLQTRNLPAQAFLGTWRVALGDSTFGTLFDEQRATVKISSSECLLSSCDAIRLIGQVTQTDSGSLPLMKSPLPYCVQGVWTYTGFWSTEVDSTTAADGFCTSKPGTGEVDWGSEHWFPPGGDRTVGEWSALNDPADDAAASGGRSQWSGANRRSIPVRFERLRCFLQTRGLRAFPKRLRCPGSTVRTPPSIPEAPLDSRR